MYIRHSDNPKIFIMAELSPLTDGMVKIHKLITRALSVSVVKCDEYIGKNQIPAGEAKGFVLYLTSLVRVMHAHHMGEDEIIFPAFNGRIEAPYDRLNEEHILMSKMLDDLGNNIEKISMSDLAGLRSSLDALQKSWAPHIRVEESSFSSGILKGKMTDEEQKILVDNVSKHGAKSSGPGSVTLPFIMYNLQEEDRKEFLRDFPWILKNFLIPVVWRSKWKPMDPFLLN